MLEPGDFIKVLREGQRMWWRVSRVDGDNVHAVLDSEPCRDPTLRVRCSFEKGDTEIFGPGEQVLDIVAAGRV